MAARHKRVPQFTVTMLLLFISCSGLSQTVAATDDDILSFMPAIIAATQKMIPIVPPPIPEAPISGFGNVRIAKTDIFNRLQPMGQTSEFISSWDSLGNNVRDDLTFFNLSGNDSNTRLGVVSINTFDAQHRPLSSSYSYEFTNDNLDQGTKEYVYVGGRLHSTLSESIFTSDITGSVTTNSETVFQYGVNSRLIGATIITSQPNSNSITTEQHTISYSANNRANSHRVIRTDNITNTSDETIHTHRYDSAGNLIESITITSTNQKIVKTFQPLNGNLITSNVEVSDQASGAVVAKIEIEGTYETGICIMRGPNDPYVIEGNITASIPYSPNVGCIKR